MSFGGSEAPRAEIFGGEFVHFDTCTTETYT
jgi:hypothetical protein